MSDPRVLITTYPEAFLHRGGGEFEIVELANNLRLLGFRVDLYGPTSQPISFYDTVLHFSVVESGMNLFRALNASAKRIVLVPNLWWIGQPSDHDRANAEEFFRLADQIVFKSTAERDNVSRYAGFPDSKAVLCPWGVDRCYAEPADPDLFKSHHQLDRYVLWLGIIEERKNQLTAIHALRDSAVPLVLVGDYRDRHYYEACRRSAPPHFKFIPHIQPKSEMLRSALQNCDVYLEASLEPAGMSAMEAYLANRPIVVSEGDWTNEHFGDEVIAIDPKSEGAIARAVGDLLQNKSSQRRTGRINRRNLLPESLEPLGRVLAGVPALRRL